MKRLAVVLALLLGLLLPGPVLGFHHGGLPAKVCAADAAGSPSNDNGNADEAIAAHNPAQSIPLPPVGTPGNAQGQGGESCANAD